MKALEIQYFYVHGLGIKVVLYICLCFHNAAFFLLHSITSTFCFVGLLVVVCFFLVRNGLVLFEHWAGLINVSVFLL